MIDPLGLDSYLVNRDLSMFGSGSRSRSDFITHTFLMNKAKSANWNNVHAYSWGNGANTKG